MFLWADKIIIRLSIPSPINQKTRRKRRVFSDPLDFCRTYDILLRYMKKVLIIGAKGMLGSELTKAFGGEEIYGWDYDEIDITDKNQVSRKIGNLCPDIIINAAAYNNVDKAEEEQQAANLLNGYAVGFLSKTANDCGATLVHYSTDYVFDGNSKDGYKEEDNPDPINAYGASKLFGENEIKNNAKKYYIIRLSKLFGKIGSSGLAKMSFIDTMLNLAQNKKDIEVINEELSSPTYAPDLAEKTKYILENLLPFGVYHGANSGACAWYELAKEIFKQTGMDTNVIAIDSDKFIRLAKRPKYSVLLNTKLPQARDWKEALRDYLNFKK